MSSNFERLQKIINQAYAENSMQNPEICQDPLSCGQDDLVLLILKIPKLILKINQLGTDCQKDTPGIYTKVEEYLKWIEDHLEE